MCDCDCVCLFFVSGWVLDCSLSWISLGPPIKCGSFFSPPHYLPAGVLVVFGVQGWVLWCVPGDSRWLLARAWTPRRCQASAWGVICPGVLGLWVHGWICLAGPVGSSLQLPGASAL
ncbi:hypothetical protein CHARACLAT_008788 [Characodon lateralis]|uniref:NADH dehydrogenase subunit 6 n=1 Tax=Characodon lateralis TaxID=208331 RepID=A0ABU7DYY3_9TELE|nr:hypothetical protein [Characodon lateralis]